MRPRARPGIIPAHGGSMSISMKKRSIFWIVMMGVILDCKRHSTCAIHEASCSKSRSCATHLLVNVLDERLPERQNGSTCREWHERDVGGERRSGLRISQSAYPCETTMSHSHTDTTMSTLLFCLIISRNGHTSTVTLLRLFRRQGTLLQC